MYSKIANPKTGRMVSVNGRLGKEILRNYLNVLSAGARRPRLERTKRALRLPAVQEMGASADYNTKKEVAETRKMLNRMKEKEMKEAPVLQAKLVAEEEERWKKWKERGVPQQLKREKIEEEREAAAEERRWRAAQEHLDWQIKTGY